VSAFRRTVASDVVPTFTLADSPLVAFYRGDGRDHRGRLLSHIYGFNFYELESHHDYAEKAPTIGTTTMGHWRSAVQKG